MDIKRELHEKLKKRIEIKNSGRFQLKTKQKRKIDKQIDMENKEMVADTRVNHIMKKWFIDAMASSQHIHVPTPSYILNNLDSTKLNFYNFLFKYMNDVKKEVDLYKSDMLKGYDKIELLSEKEEYLVNLNNEYKKKYKNYFTTPYIIYMSLMTNIDIYDDLLKI